MWHLGEGSGAAVHRIDNKWEKCYCCALTHSNKLVLFLRCWPTSELQTIETTKCQNAFRFDSGEALQCPAVPVHSGVCWDMLKTENLLFQEGNEGISEIQMDELKVMALGIAQKGGNLYCRYFPPSELRIDGRCFKVKLFPWYCIAREDFLPID